MASEHDQEHREGGFLRRGGETTRLETFVDAAFAFALTLLVISFDAVPETYAEMVQALRAVPAFLFGFAILMMFWLAHRKWSLRYGLDTTLDNIISLALVFVILVYVYPLRAMAQAAVSAITGGWLLPTFQITSWDQLRSMFVIYGIGFLAATLCIAALYAHALHRRHEVGLSASEVFLTRDEVFAWLIVGSIGLLSALLAVLLPTRWVGFAGWSYFALPVLMTLWGHWRGRRYRTEFPSILERKGPSPGS